MGDERKLLAEWFWADRWMGSSAFLLPLEPRGLYREMLTQSWRRGARLPNDPEAIRRATGCTLKEWSRCWPQIAKFWTVEGDDLVNVTQQEVYAVTVGLSETRARAGRVGGTARNAKQTPSKTQANGQANGVANGVAKAKPPSPSPSPSPKDKEKEKDTHTDPIQRLVEKHDELHRKYVGVGYIGNPHKDYDAARQLVAAIPNVALQDAILIYGLNDADDFMTQGNRTIGKIASRASAYVHILKEKKLVEV